MPNSLLSLENDLCNSKSVKLHHQQCSFLFQRYMEVGVQATPPLLKTGAISTQMVMFPAAVFDKNPAALTTSQVRDGTEQLAGS